MGSVTFNGNSSTNYGFEIVAPPVHNIAKKLYDITTVPGKSGKNMYDTGAYDNVKRVYEISFISADTYEASVRRILEFLYSGSGYLRLEDTYEPDYYREACYYDEAEIANIYNEGGVVKLTFDCKPYCWLKSGEEVVTINGTTTIRNETINIAYPFIEAECAGSGTIFVGPNENEGNTLTISEYTGKIYLDSDKRDAYGFNNGAVVNLNDYVENTSVYPVLVPGDNVIIVTGDISSIKLTPRWWVL